MSLLKVNDLKLSRLLTAFLLRLEKEKSWALSENPEAARLLLHLGSWGFCRKIQPFLAKFFTGMM